MEQLFRQALIKALKAVVNATGKELLDPDFEEKVFESCRFGIPILQTNKTKVIVDRVVLPVEKLPPGISAGEGETVLLDCVIYTVPFKGEENLFAAIAATELNAVDTYLRHYTLIYEVYSEGPVNEDEVLEAGIREKAKNAITAIQLKLSDFEQNAFAFYNERLKPAIRKQISFELSQRKHGTAGRKRLNPFTGD